MLHTQWRELHLAVQWRELLLVDDNKLEEGDCKTVSMDTDQMHATINRFCEDLRAVWCTAKVLTYLLNWRWELAWLDLYMIRLPEWIDFGSLDCILSANSYSSTMMRHWVKLGAMSYCSLDSTTVSFPIFKHLLGGEKARPTFQLAVL